MSAAVLFFLIGLAMVAVCTKPGQILGGIIMLGAGVAISFAVFMSILPLLALVVFPIAAAYFVLKVFVSK